MSLTRAQILAIDVTEKAGSVFSVLGEAFVISTFLFSSKFRKPINRLVFYATWGNILANVATLIGRSGIGSGLDTPLCQLQAFLIQWFMPADALWTFAMACNVWLSFFRHYDAVKLRSLEWKYLLLCYGLPFPPAFIYLFAANSSRGRVYGDAVLWCWVSLRWDFLRVTVFYAPVWIVILLTIGIYLRVGAMIWKWRRQLISLGRREDLECHRNSQNNSTPVYGIRRTDEVTITRDLSFDDIPVTPFGNNTPIRLREPKAGTQPMMQCQSQVSTTPRRNNGRKRGGTLGEATSHTNKATIKYCKCALLFFVALLVTWVPSTINRIYTLIYPQELLFGLQFAASLVLPLQGFWNAVVYVATSVFACKCLWQEMLMVLGFRKRPSEVVPMRRNIRGLSFDSRRGWPAESDTYSLKTSPTHQHQVRGLRRAQSWQGRRTSPYST